jgi:hypothetical protein
MSRKTVGLPPAAPLCNGCDLRLKPMYDSDWQRKEDGSLISGSRVLKFWGWREYHGFHSLRCAARFAAKAYVAGFRVTK